MTADQIRAMAQECINAQGVDDAAYFTLLDKLARALASSMFDTARRLGSLAA